MDQRHASLRGGQFRGVDLLGSIDDYRSDILPCIIGASAIGPAQVQQSQVRLDRAEQPVHARITGCRNVEPRFARPLRQSLRQPRTPSARAACAADRRRIGRRWRWSAAARRSSTLPELAMRPARLRTAEPRKRPNPVRGLSRRSELAPGSGRRTSTRLIQRRTASGSIRVPCPAARARVAQAGRSSPQSNTTRSSTISLPSSLNNCARIRRSPSSKAQNAATGEWQVASSVRVNARSAITQW